MAVAVVDFLEVVEVDGNDGDLVPRLLGPGQCPVEGFPEARPVRQARQAIMAGQMGDGALRAMPFGDVVDRGHPGAVADGAVADLQDPVLGEGVDDLAALCDQRRMARHHLIDAGFEIFRRMLAAQNAQMAGAAKADARQVHRRVDAKQGWKALVVELQTPLGVVEAQPLRHMGHGQFELAGDLADPGCVPQLPLVFAFGAAPVGLVEHRAAQGQRQ